MNKLKFGQYNNKKLCAFYEANPDSKEITTLLKDYDISDIFTKVITADVFSLYEKLLTVDTKLSNELAQRYYRCLVINYIFCQHGTKMHCLGLDGDGYYESFSQYVSKPYLLNRIRYDVTVDEVFTEDNYSYYKITSLVASVYNKSFRLTKYINKDIKYRTFYEVSAFIDDFSILDAIKDNADYYFDFQLRDGLQVGYEDEGLMVYFTEKESASAFNDQFNKDTQIPISAWRIDNNTTRVFKGDVFPLIFHDVVEVYKLNGN